MKQGYKDLVVWQKSMDLVEKGYDLTKDHPKEEIYGLTSQMRRLAVSVPSNIAKGSRRGGEETKRFLRIAFASGAELETQIEISKRLGLVKKHECVTTENVLEEIMKMLNVMINR